MTRLVLLSCALLVACGGGGKVVEPTYDLAGLDLARLHGDGDAATIGDLSATGDMTPTDMTPTDMTPTDMAMSVNAPRIMLILPSGNQKSSNLIIKVSVTSPNSATIVSVTAAVGGGANPILSTFSQIQTGVWQGTADVTTLASGTSVPLVITATDANGAVGTLPTSFTLDHGPNIAFLQPTAKTAKDSIPLKVQITDPLGQPIDPAKVTVGVRMADDVTYTTTTTGGILEVDATITFNDPKFGMPLTANQVITVTATNADGATATAQKQFTVDEAGPEITISAPAQNSFAGGLTSVQATVVDVSGVNKATVVAVFAGNSMFQVTLTPDPVIADLYTAIYDLSALGDTLSIPTVSVTAQDQLGNETSLAQPFYLDNRKPIVSLTPPTDMRVKRQADNVCSEPFDPVGTDAVNDLDTSLQALTIRARIEDQANHVSGQTVVFPSGVKQVSVRLIVTPAATLNNADPILVVNDGAYKSSTDCDTINPALTPVASGMPATAGQYISLDMDPLIATGQPDFSPDTTNVPSACAAVGDVGASPPAPLCSSSGSPMSLALQYLNYSTPAIWSLPTVGTSSTNCVGQQFDSGNLLPEGWACFAAIATDNSGNKSVSPPLRTCIRYPMSALSPHPCDTQAPPDCRGTYTTAGGTTNTRCNAVNFDAGQIRTLPN